MRAKTLKVLLVLLLSEGGDDVVDDGHVPQAGHPVFIAFYLHLEVNLQTPALQIHLHGPVDKA